MRGVNTISRFLALLLCVLCGAWSIFAAESAGGDLAIARQALQEGVWRSALSSADRAAATTNAAERTAARLISLEALARLEDDAEIRRRLGHWRDEKGEAFRFWRARE